MKYIFTSLALCLASWSQAAQVHVDFESGELSPWRIVHGEFGKLVSDTPHFFQAGPKYNKEGKFHLTTLETKEGGPSDQFIGMIQSPLYVLEGPKITMLVGGGMSPQTYVALYDEHGVELVRAQGKNAEKMEEVTWDLPDAVGKKVFFGITDMSQGGWGHVTVDNIVFEGKLVDSDEAYWSVTAPVRTVDTTSLSSLKKTVTYLKDAYGDQYPRGEEFLRSLAELEKKPNIAVQERLAEEILQKTSEMKRWQNVVRYEGINRASASTLRAALEDLQSTYGDKFPQAKEALAKLDGLDAEKDAEQIALLAQDVLKLNPLLAAQPLLFIERPQYAPDHHNTETFFQTNEINTSAYRPGGVMKTLDVKSGEIKMLYDPGEKGMVRDPEIHFDGEKLIFAARKDIDDNYHIMEMKVDGSEVKTLTGLPNVSDVDPLYLPNGEIIFTSTRQPKFCMCNRHIMGNMYKMEADGANPYPIGRSTLHEGHASLMPDGRILYDRWEYVDKDFGSAQGLWTVNPDGTSHVIYWGNNTESPGGVIDARYIPGTQKVLAVLAACHDRPWGALGIIDRQKGLDGREPVERTWPAYYHRYISADGGGIDSPGVVRNKFEDPYPLSDKYFLASRMIDAGKYGEKTGIFLIDIFGNETLVYAAETDKGCYDPMPIAKKARPAAQPSRVDYAKKSGAFFVQNVYEGTHMDGVQPGEIKFLRIVESPEKRAWTKHDWTGQGAQAPAMNWHSFENKRILGTVPVESDGSAYFEVPADTFVYFQALDKDGRLVQSMRSGTIVRPGEHQSCVGCHEDRLSSPPANMGQAMASRRKPDKMSGWKGETRMFNYYQDVQPIFDKNCLSCHDFGKKGAEKLILAGDLTMPFNISYNELWRKGYTNSIGGGSSTMRPAKEWGSQKSRLIETLRKGHNNVKLTPEEMQTLVTWIDLNGVYYPYYETSYTEGVHGRGPLTPPEFEKLCGIVKDAAFTGISLSQPERSPILKTLPEPQAKEVLALLQEGKKRLDKTPRAEMKGFKPAESEQNALHAYSLLGKMEAAVRQAIVENKKIYDKDYPKYLKTAPKK